MARLVTMSDMDFLQERRTIECDIEMIGAIIDDKKRFLARHKEDGNFRLVPHAEIKPYEEAMIVMAITCLARAKDALGIALEHWRKV